MESSFLLEKKIISMCFNPIRDSVFVLCMESDNLDLVEEDLSKNIILKRFKLLKISECNIINTNFRKLPKDTYEGYNLYFWELARKLIVIYPFGYILIYDYQSGALNYHFQCQGKKAYVIRNLIGSPIQRSLFISAEKMRNVYHFSFDNIKGNSGVTFQKLVLPQNESVYDLVCHPNEKFIFAACSDSIIRIYDYSNFNNILEVNGLVDVAMGKDNKPMKNQNELIKKSNLQGVLTMDINYNGTYLISGNENGFVYLWNALSAIKNKRMLLINGKFSGSGILSLKFIKTKQFENLDRFICLTKEGKFFINNIIMKEENNIKSYSFNKLYENSIFNPIIYNLSNYNLITSNFVNISNFSNIICLKWPQLRMDKIIENEKKQDYLLFTSFFAKFFFFYDNVFPKINFAIATQMKYKNYEEYIPITNKNNLIYERKVFTVDNFFIYFYEIMTGNTKRMLNYTKEYNLKAISPLKLEVKILDKENEIYFVILAENENFSKFVLFIHFDMLQGQVKTAQKFDDMIDFTILGKEEENENFKNILLIHKNKQNAIIYDIIENKKITKNIEGSALRVYYTPFCNGMCVMYRNVLSELKFSANLNSSDIYDFKCINDNNFKLDYSEREIDLAWKKIENDRYLCAISMIEKIVITDENMKILYSFKIGLLENPNIISSLFWIGKTLFYSKGSSINYFYGEDNIQQKIFSSDLPNTTISGIISDRYILVSKNTNSKEVNNVIITTPMLNPIEPILIGYLDSQNLDYNLVKEAVTNMFTNQISQNLIEKLLKRNLKEVAWLFLSDSKSSFQNIDMKVQILNDLLKFDLSMDYMLQNKNLKNEMDLDELIWKFNYDHSMEYIKNILVGECNILINYGQFDYALKILEILGDCPKAINLLLIASTKEEYENLKVLFQAKGCLSYTDNLLTNNIFHVMKSQGKNENNNMKHYQKIFDNYRGEPFIFGANFDKFNPISHKTALNKINKKNSNVSNITKKILSFGETPFTQFIQLFNRETSTYELMSVCTLILQKVDQFYGHKNTIYDKNQGGVNASKKNDFMDYTMPLSDLKEISKENDDDDNSIDSNSEEINENLYLSAYFHCDKGIGNVVEDITENNTMATLTILNPNDSNEINNKSPNQINLNSEDFSKIEENYFWSNMLEEFEPLEYEDKWGRKSPGSHAIKFSMKFGSSLTIKHSNHFNHFSKKFTIEFWLKILNINVSLIHKDTFNIEIQNGNFIAHYQNKLLTPIKLLDYSIQPDKWNHLTISYIKKMNKIRIFLNCEEVVNFNITLMPEISLKSDIIFGNANLDGEITEIRIWNQEIPLKFIKENFKSPLPILAENKRKLRMKINKQEENAGKKKFEFNKNNNTNRFQSFAFGNNNKFASNIINNIQKENIMKSEISPIRSNQIIAEDEIPDGDSIILSEPQVGNNLYEFKPGKFNNDMAEVIYPTLTSVLNDNRSVMTEIKNEVEFGQDNNFNFNMENNNNTNNNFNEFQINYEKPDNNFDFNKEDFNFDK